MRQSILRPVGWLLFNFAEERNEFAELFALLCGVTRMDGLFNTAGGVIAQNQVFYFGQSGFNRLHLMQYVDAITLILNHARDAANLSFNFVQSSNDMILFHVAA